MRKFKHGVVDKKWEGVEISTVELWRVGTVDYRDSGPEILYLYILTFDSLTTVIGEKLLSYYASRCNTIRLVD
jgi:hypothetical protein